jgi:prolyl 4-hydroxylase
MEIPAAQLDQIRAKADNGNPESQFLLSQICLQQGDMAEMVHWLRAASASGVPDAVTALGHCHERGMGIERDFETALELYGDAIEKGSVPAGYRRAELLYKSRQGPGMCDEIHALLSRAAASGFEPARRTLAYLASQSGLPAGSLPAAADLYPAPRNLARQEFSSDLPVALYNGVLDAEECAYLVALSRPYLRHSDVIDPASQRGGMVSDVRTSSGTYLPFERVDIVARYIEMKIVQATGEDLEHSEPMSILCYKPGEYYQPHFDYFDPKLNVSEGLMEDGGQRTASAVTYLATPTRGGGTSFPKLGITVPPALGASLWFRNCNTAGDIDPRSLHAGDTVDEGEKWVVTKWFREERTHYAEF